MNPRHLKYSEKESEMELLFTLGALSVYCPCMERVEEGEVRVVVEGGGEGGRRGGGEGWEGVMVADTSVPPLPPQRLSALHSTIKPTVT